MMRVLHVLDLGSREATAAKRRLVGETMRWLAQWHGVESRVLWVPGRALPRLAWIAKRWREMERVGEAVGGVFDVVHTWSAGSAAAVRMLRPGVPMVFTPGVVGDGGVWARAGHAMLRRAAGRRGGGGGVVVVPLSRAVAVQWSGAGVSMEPVLPPGVEGVGGVKLAEVRVVVRREWGVDGQGGAGGVEGVVLGTVSEPMWEAEAVTAMMVLCILRESHVRKVGGRPGLYLMVHPRQERRERVQRLLGNIGQRGRVFQEERAGEPWAVMPGWEVGLVVGPEGDGLARAWAAASGVAMVIPRGSAAAEGLQHGEQAMLAVDDGYRGWAREVDRLLMEPPLAEHVRGGARAWAAREHAPTVYAARLAEMYAAVA